MIGIIVTGHGGFARGLEKNVKMLAGAEAQVTAIDFMEGMPLEELEEKISDAMEAMSGKDWIVVFTDIAGGTPYNKASTLSVNCPKVRVVSGVNSAMLMELVMYNITGNEVEDIDAVLDDLMETGREGIGKFALDIPAAADNGDDDGI